jgi:putative FmdB family regulatory protein
VPTYQYACTDCGEQLEVVQKFTDDALTVCPACDGRLRKVFSAVGVVFKGSGFYRTDSRALANGSSDGSAKPDKAASNGDDGSKDGAKDAAKAGAKESGGSSSPGSSGGSESSGSSSKAASTSAA